MGNTVKLTFAGDAGQLDKTYKQVGAGAKKMADEVGKASDEMGAGGERGAKKFGDGLGKLKGVGVVAGGLAAAGLGKAFADSLDISAGNAKLAGQFGLTRDQAAAAGQAAGGVFATGMTDNMAEANEAVKAVGTSMLDLRSAPAAAVQDLSTRALLLSKTFDIDVNEATRGAGRLMKDGLARDGVEAFDLITRSMQVSGDASGDLLDTVNEYSPFLKRLGIDGSSAFGSLAAAQKLGIRDTDAWGDAIKEFSLRAIDGSKTTVDAYKSLHLNADQTAKAIAGGGPAAERAMSTVVRALQGVKDPVERNRIGVELFGTQWEDTARDILPALDPLANKMTDVAGATDRMNDSTTTAQQKVQELKNRFQLWAAGLVETKGPLGDVAAGVMAFGPDALSTLAPLGSMVAALRMQGAVGALSAVGTEVAAVGTKADVARVKSGNLKGALKGIGVGLALGAVALAMDKINQSSEGGNLSGWNGELHDLSRIMTGDWGNPLADVEAQMSATARNIQSGNSPVGQMFGWLKRQMTEPLPPLQFDVNTGPAVAQVDSFIGSVNSAAPQVNINGNNNGAGFALREVLAEIAAGKESVVIDGQPIPAQDALRYVTGLISNSAGTVTINGQNVPAGQALADILNRTSRSSANMNIGANTGPAQGAINSFIQMNNGRRINIMVTTTGSGGIASAGRLAGGGPIKGPGSGTSDTAGLYALSNGEYVATARQVDNAGGPAAFGRLMSALDRAPAGLAAGGPASPMRAPAQVAIRSAAAPGGGAVQVQLVAGPGADAGAATFIAGLVRTGKLQLKAVA